MKLLLHQCCAPCSVKVVERLKEKFSLVGFWFNPNIQPLSEYLRRDESFTAYNRAQALDWIEEEKSFPLWWKEISAKWEVSQDKKDRCRLCYQLRLEKTAEKALSLGIKYFSTTLLVSPYQDHNQIAEIGETLAERFGLEFLYQDFRPDYYQGRNYARQQGMYLQKYCGCLYSREERQNKQVKAEVEV